MPHAARYQEAISSERVAALSVAEDVTEQAQDGTFEEDGYPLNPLTELPILSVSSEDLRAPMSLLDPDEGLDSDDDQSESSCGEEHGYDGEPVDLWMFKTLPPAYQVRCIRLIQREHMAVSEAIYKTCREHDFGIFSLLPDQRTNLCTAIRGRLHQANDGFLKAWLALCDYPKSHPSHHKAQRVASLILERPRQQSVEMVGQWIQEIRSNGRTEHLLFQLELMYDYGRDATTHRYELECFQEYDALRPDESLIEQILPMQPSALIRANRHMQVAWDLLELEEEVFKVDDELRETLTAFHLWLRAQQSLDADSTMPERQRLRHSVIKQFCSRFMDAFEGHRTGFVRRTLSEVLDMDKSFPYASVRSIHQAQQGLATAIMYIDSLLPYISAAAFREPGPLTSTATSFYGEVLYVKIGFEPLLHSLDKLADFVSTTAPREDRYTPRHAQHPLHRLLTATEARRRAHDAIHAHRQRFYAHRDALRAQAAQHTHGQTQLLLIDALSTAPPRLSAVHHARALAAVADAPVALRNNVDAVAAELEALVRADESLANRPPAANTGALDQLSALDLLDLTRAGGPEADVLAALRAAAPPLSAVRLSPPQKSALLAALDAHDCGAAWRAVAAAERWEEASGSSRARTQFLVRHGHTRYLLRQWRRLQRAAFPTKRSGGGSSGSRKGAFVAAADRRDIEAQARVVVAGLYHSQCTDQEFLLRPQEATRWVWETAILSAWAAWWRALRGRLWRVRNWYREHGLRRREVEWGVVRWERVVELATVERAFPASTAGKLEGKGRVDVEGDLREIRRLLDRRRNLRHVTQVFAETPWSVDEEVVAGLGLDAVLEKEDEHVARRYAEMRRFATLDVERDLLEGGRIEVTDKELEFWC